MPITRRGPKRAKSILCLHCLSCCYIEQIMRLILCCLNETCDLFDTSSGDKECSYLSLTLSWLCAHLYLIFSCLLCVFHHVHTACSLLSHLRQFSVFHEHVGILKVIHTKMCVDHHIESSKYMHPRKGACDSKLHAVYYHICSFRYSINM